MKYLSRLVDPNDREVKQHMRTAEAIGALEPDLQKLDDAGLQARSAELKARVAEGGGSPEILEDVLIEAFALVREAARRTIGLRPYDVQLLGGMQGRDRGRPAIRILRHRRFDLLP